MFARPFIDSLDFARKGNELRGEIPFSELARLQDVLLSHEGSLSYILRGEQNGEQSMLALALSGVCHLRCQRCLGDLIFPLEMETALHLLPADKLEALEADEEIDCIEASHHLDVLALVEDEILLGLPFAPKHAEGVCNQAVAGKQESAHPFAVLAGLKNKQ